MAAARSHRKSPEKARCSQVSGEVCASSAFGICGQAKAADEPARVYEATCYAVASFFGSLYRGMVFGTSEKDVENECKRAVADAHLKEPAHTRQDTEDDFELYDGYSVPCIEDSLPVCLNHIRNRVGPCSHKNIFYCEGKAPVVGIFGDYMSLTNSYMAHFKVQPAWIISTIHVRLSQDSNSFSNDSKFRSDRIAFSSKDWGFCGYSLSNGHINNHGIITMQDVDSTGFMIFVEVKTGAGAGNSSVES